MTVRTRLRPPRVRRTLAAGVGVFALTLGVAGLGSASVASAQPAAVAPAAVRVAAVRATPPPTVAQTASAPASGSARAAVIRCTLTSDHPHRSHTKGKTKQINFHPVVSCTAPVPRINLAARMVRSTGEVGAIKSFGPKAGTYLKGNAQLRCTAKKRGYTGLASANVQMPPRYSPPVLYLNIQSPTKYLNCKS